MDPRRYYSKCDKKFFWSGPTAQWSFSLPCFCKRWYQCRFVWIYLIIYHCSICYHVSLGITIADNHHHHHQEQVCRHFLGERWRQLLRTSRPIFVDNHRTAWHSFIPHPRFALHCYGYPPTFRFGLCVIFAKSMLPVLIHTILPQAGNGVYELTDAVHPGGGAVFKNLCAGNGRTKGRPLKTVNWADILLSSHPYGTNRATNPRPRCLIDN